ncbi:MAG: TonB-dependent receptor [Cytophagales bacterium]|nr:MAG: TonB-dependent receptor [Cytophagales bacterium]
MKKRIIIYIGVQILLTQFILLQAQNINGVVKEKNEQADSPLIGANLIIQETNKGVTTNAEGYFTIETSQYPIHLIISYVGYRTDTLLLTAPPQKPIEIYLTSEVSLESVEIKASKTLSVETIQSETLTTRDLQKAACCNLSESFETNASVDVSNTDAVSGTKQIRMLGLDGVYAQLMTENMPAIRGLSARSGLYFIPGTWIKSIDINKGAGSVINGYEAITGQINIDYGEIPKNEALLLNFYTNIAGRIEGNANINIKLSEKWSIATLLHASDLSQQVDNNQDGFQDIPRFTQFNVLQRLMFASKDFMWQLGIQALTDDKIGGQTLFATDQQRSFSSPYGVRFTTNRLQVFSKLGYLPRQKPTQSIALTTTAVWHDQNSFWGMNNYEAEQQYWNANLIYQNKFAPKHELKIGGNITIDNYKENYQENLLSSGSQTFIRKREETVLGIFAEYTFKPSESWVLVAGLRTDFHNLYGNIPSPRLHIKYDINDNTTLRLSGGRGFRVANPIIEGNSYLISSRKLYIEPNLQPEIAWNYGASLSQRFFINGYTGILTVDFYRTQFENQIVMDLDNNSHEVLFYNLRGLSFANSFQTQVSYEPFKRFDVTMAYKYYDVQTTLSNQLMEVPFVAKHRAFINLAYSTKKDAWQFDLTAEYVGAQRLPNTRQMPADMQLPSYSPEFILLNMQITKNWKNWAFYVGAEDLANYMQDMPIMAADQPHGEHFDAGLIYAPVMGRMVYTGVRFQWDTWKP